jgi:hypothetical protein
MGVPTPKLLQTVAFTLEHKILPELTGATWTASYVRSCLVLLAYVQARSGIDDALLREDSAELRAILTKAGALPVDLADATGEPHCENERLQLALDELIERAYGEDQGLLALLREDLRQYRKRAVDRDARLLGPAINMSPL